MLSLHHYFSQHFGHYNVCLICGGQSGIWTDVLPSTLVFPYLLSFYNHFIFIVAHLLFMLSSHDSDRTVRQKELQCIFCIWCTDSWHYVSEGAYYGLKLQVENKVKGCELCMYALLYGYNPVYTPLVCVYSVHTLFNLRNTTYLHTQCRSPHVFAIGKMSKKERQSSLVIRKRHVCSKKWQLLLIQSHISHFYFATMNYNTGHTFLAEICSK
jgi:hypothetical protein